MLATATFLTAIPDAAPNDGGSGVRAPNRRPAVARTGCGTSMAQATSAACAASIRGRLDCRLRSRASRREKPARVALRFARAATHQRPMSPPRTPTRFAQQLCRARLTTTRQGVGINT
ncbi:MAG: hypothetical protein CMJ58_11580 [Planctomycetaceae bacterium]|nr:hypothetical protein [Planctomycetaceae bacterium]